MQDVLGESIDMSTRLGVRWSVEIEVNGIRVAAHEPDLVLPTASLGKVLLLITLAQEFAAGTVWREEPCEPDDDQRVGDSGLWQWLSVNSFTLNDLAVLIGAVSDNQATNVALARVGIDRVQQTADELGLNSMALLDRIRDERTQAHPVAPSVACAGEAAYLMYRLAVAEGLDVPVAAEVVHWLSLNTDLSMVASEFGADPLAHANAPVRLFNKTGTDVAIRADAGALMARDGVVVSYAALAQWDCDGADHSAVVMHDMAAIGKVIQTMAQNQTRPA